jgi:hypothetical protein
VPQHDSIFRVAAKQKGFPLLSGLGMGASTFLDIRTETLHPKPSAFYLSKSSQKSKQIKPYLQIFSQ